MKTIAMLLCLTTTAFAALPPFAQSKNELQSILSDGRLYSLLGSSGSINEIVRSGNGYDVLTTSRKVHVEIVYEKNGKIGPADYHLEFSPVSGL